MIKEETKISFICDYCGKEEEINRSIKDTDVGEIYGSGFKNLISIPDGWRKINDLDVIYKIDKNELMFCSKTCLSKYIDKNINKIKEIIINNIFN